MEQETEKNQYEITFHVLSEEQAGVIKSYIEKHGGVITNERQLEKVRLAYPVKKQSYGFMSSICFEAEPNIIKEISDDIGLNKDVLRVLISRLSPKKDKKKKSKQSAGVPLQSSPENAKRLRPFGQALSNEALEKKIEEILQ